MKTILMLLIVAFLPLSSYALDIDDRTPDFRGTSLKGEKISYNADLYGKKPVYLIFWATWCPICKEELPHLEALHKKLGDKIEFIGINVGINERIEGVQEYVRKKNMSYTVIFDRDRTIGKSFGVMGTPTHIIIDRNGVIKYRSAGMPLDLAEHMNDLMQK